MQGGRSVVRKKKNMKQEILIRINAGEPEGKGVEDEFRGTTSDKIEERNDAIYLPSECE